LGLKSNFLSEFRLYTRIFVCKIEFRNDGFSNLIVFVSKAKQKVNRTHMDQTKPTYEDLEKRIKDLELILQSQKQSLGEIPQYSQPKIENFPKGMESVNQDKSIIQKFLQSEDLITNLLNNIDIGIVVHGADGSVILCNYRATEIFGFSENLLIGAKSFPPDWKITDINGEIIQPEQLPLMEIKRTKKSIQNKQMAISRPNITEPIWLKINGFPVFDHHGELDEIIISLMDITNQKKAETEYIQINSLLSDFIRYSPIQTYIKEVTNTESRVFAASQNFMDMIGKTGNEIIGKNMSEIFQEEFAQKITLDDQEVVNKGKILKIDEEYCGRSYITIKFPIFLKNRNLLAGFTIDITERKAASDEVAKLSKHYQALLEKAPDGVVTLDAAMQFTYYSPSAKRIFGYENDEDISLDPTENTHPDELNFVLSELGRLLVEPSYVPTLQYRFRHKSGKYLWIESTFSNFLSDPDVNSIIINFRDITDRKLINEAIIKKNQELQLLNSEKDKVFSVIAHDLRSPFNVFLGFTRMMVEDLPTLRIDEIQTIALTMRESANNLYSLLENLLEWSRIQRNITGFKPEDIPLSTHLSESTYYLNDLAKRKGIQIKKMIAEDIKVKADRNLLSAIFRNLISNAVKFSHQGDIVTIKASAESESSIKISVQDTGIGMSKDILKNLFTLNDNMSRRGTSGEPSTGLGLIICKEFIEKCGGKMMVESEENTGSIFSFDLPAK
jgi:PAS domain S-box-containing protein